MTTDRKRTLAAGVFYLVTFVAIPALIHIGPVLDDPNYIVSDGVDTRVLLGCVLDIVVALTCIGTAVALFPSCAGTTRPRRWDSLPPECSKPASSSSASPASSLW